MANPKETAPAPNVWSTRSAPLSDQVAADRIAILGEDTSLREEASKRFRLKGSTATMAVLYPVSVHYPENGKWQDIDNRLEEGKDGTYRNRACDVDFTLPKTISEKDGVTITCSGYTLSFRLKGVMPSEAVIEKEEEPESPNERMTAVHTDSGAVYPEAFPGADLRYHLRSKTLKESIVLHTRESVKDEYTAAVTAPGLAPELCGDGSVAFYDEKGTAVFRIPPAFLYDAQGLPGDVEAVLVPQEDGEALLTYRPDRKWLDDPERTWPVVLDPTIYTMLSYNAFEDCYVTTKSKGTAYPSTINLIVGNAGTSGTCRAFMRINNLPAISSANTIVDARLHYYCEFSSSVDGEVQTNLYKVTSDTVRNYSSITWNNQPGYDPQALDFKLNYKKKMGWNIFDITRAARDWYAGEINNGLLFKSTTEGTYCWYYYYAKENPGNTRLPKLEIFYVHTNGQEDCWDYSKQDVGRAGTAYVQDFTGNFLMSRTDMGFGGNRMPASVSFSYSLADRSTDLGYGYGWRTNYAQTLESCTISVINYYRWTDGDGTEKYFYKDTNNVWKDELGYGYTLTIGNDDATKYTVTDKKDNEMVFNSAGRLVALRDAFGNAVTITHDVDGRIATVTDGAGRHYNFVYANGRLSSLAYTGAGNTSLETVAYTYTSDGDLASVTYPDSETALYEWETGHILSSAKDIDRTGGRDRIDVECTASDPPKTESVEYTSRNTQVSKLSFEYGDKTTKVTDLLGRYVIYQFNNFGNTTAVYNNLGQALYGRYAQDADSANRANQLVAGSRLQGNCKEDESNSVIVQIGNTSETIPLTDHTNLLNNPDISDPIASTNWVKVEGTSSDVRVEVSNDPGETRGGLDDWALYIKGAAKKAKQFKQTVDYTNNPGTAGDIFTFGGWAKTKTVALDSAAYQGRTSYPRRAGIWVALYNGSTKVSDSYVAVNEDTNYWQFLSGKVTATGTYTKAVFAFVYENNANEAWFDGAQLYREPFDYVYTYDDDTGNLTSVKDPEGNETAYTYVTDTSDIASITLPGGGVYSYTYNGDHQLTNSVTATGLATDYDYDLYGNSTGVSIYPEDAQEGDRVIRSDSTYTSDGNMTATTTSGDRNTVTYTNNTDLSLVTALTDAKNAVTAYSYDSMRRRILTTGPNGSTVSNVYTDDLLTGVSHSNGTGVSTDYGFEYGTANLATAVKIGSTRTLVTNTYNTSYWTLSEQLFGNGEWWRYEYNEQSDELEKKYTGISATAAIGYEYGYDSRGRNVRVEKKLLTLSDGALTENAGTLLGSEHYGYDAMDRLDRIVTADGSGNLVADVHWTYDADKNITSVTTRINENGVLRTETRSFTYDDDHRPVGAAIGNISESIAYDDYSRISGKTVENGNSTVLSTAYTYRDVGTDYTANQIAGVSSTFGNTALAHSYTYDANGNILTDSDGTNTTEYVYDSLNQLVWEKNEAAHKAWEYIYDLGGNITKKTEYTYQNGQTTNPQEINYTYGDSEWHDLLTAWNNQTITYDVNDDTGNPVSYRGWTMTWVGGRQLAGMTDGTDTLSFAYNEKGLRTEKTVNNVTRKYIWNDKQLIADIGPADAFYFRYNSGGDMLGYRYKAGNTETECVFVKNQQGDVERILDAGTGTVLASYTYDAWGRVLVSDGDMADNNPIRYRGYYYDSETGLYYLKSRYYDSLVGRFINTDGQIVSGLQGNYNLYEYCNNNPEMSTDDSGLSPKWWQWALSATMVVGGIALIATGVSSPVGGALLAAGVNSMVTGYLNEAQGGSFTGGWCGGAVFGLLAGAGAGAGGEAFLASTSCVGAKALLKLGEFATLSFAGGYSGALAGAGVISLYDNTTTNWTSLNDTALFCGALNMAAGIGSFMSTVITNGGFTFAYHFVGGSVSLYAEIICDTIIAGYSIFKKRKKRVLHSSGASGAGVLVEMTQ